FGPYSETSVTLTEHPANSIRKIRKPVVEKMRRDRINSSIEQLRMLLEKEFEKHNLPSKPEKADILEVAVGFLQQHIATKITQEDSRVHILDHS
uniref:Transcription factor HES-5 n=1 Tax=Xenopus tropicalis TaxID=8364 RepID=F7ASX3_XENTR